VPESQQGNDMTSLENASWPEWWEWELEFTSHVLKRMIDRRFSEIDLRSMLEEATSLREDDEPGRWVVETSHDSRSWEVIVEPDRAEQLLVVVTAYPVESP
jgi:hypothetical protein